MSLSYVEIEFVVTEIRKTLFGEDKDAFVNIQKVFEKDKNTIVFQLRAKRETTYLLISATDRDARLYPIDEKPRQPSSPTAFTMALRKYAIGPLFNINLDNTDRIVSFHFGETKLIAELASLYASLILVDNEEKVIAATRYGQRVRPGQPYKKRPLSGTFSGKENRFNDIKTLRDFYEEKTQKNEFNAVYLEIKKGIKRKKKHLLKIVTKLNQELQRSEDAEHFQKWGTLLQSKIGQVSRGEKSVEVIDYYAKDLPKLQIPLDEKKSLQENITRYFHQYKRLNSALERIFVRLEKIENELKEVVDFEETLQMTQDFDKILKLFELAKKKKIIKAKQITREAKAKEIRLPYRIYFASSGVEIWVGRSSKDNDILSLKRARGNDIWLHARDWQGSHVILRTTMEKLKSEDLIDAAILAAYFSKGKNDSNTEVSYTNAKHIRKPKGAPPGLVSMASSKTILVKQNATRLEKLLATLKEVR